jgi:hypothetical protein
MLVIPARLPRRGCTGGAGTFGPDLGQARYVLTKRHRRVSIADVAHMLSGQSGDVRISGTQAFRGHGRLRGRNTEPISIAPMPTLRCPSNCRPALRTRRPQRRRTTRYARAGTLRR